MIDATWPVIGVRVGFIVAGLLAWYWTQSVIGKRTPKVAYEVPLTDGIHVFTARLHQRYATNVAAGNRLLIISSLVIDLLGGYLLCSAIFGGAPSVARSSAHASGARMSKIAMTATACRERMLN